MTTLADALRQTGYSQDGELAVPTPVEPTMTSILQKHIATLPQQLATNQAALDSAIGSWNKTDFGTGLPNPNYRPEAMQELTQLMPNIMGATAWHGTPHKIQGQFDISKVGTGEGAQAYGHGMYFAENPKVANEYARELGSKIDVNGKPLYNANKTVGTTGNAELDDYLVANVGDVKATRKQLLNDIKEIRPTNPEAAKEMQQTLADLRKANVGVQDTGNLYKVDIPDEHIPNMLDWDKPLSQQSDVVRQALGLPKDKFAGFKVPATGTNYSFSPKMTGAEFYKELTDLAKTKAGATEMLNSMGVKGIRYLDEGSRASKITKTPIAQLDAKIDILKKDLDSGLGNKEVMERQLKVLQDERARTTNQTSNFVVFDPSTVKILEENGKPLSRKELIKQQVNKVIE